jgi:hypothetical protein
MLAPVSVLVHKEVDLQFAAVANGYPSLSFRRVLTRPFWNHDVNPRELFRRRFAEGAGHRLIEESLLGLCKPGYPAMAFILTGHQTILP